LEKQSKAYKVKTRTELKKLLTVLRSKTYLVYVLTRNTIIKTLFIKLYEPKNPLALKEVSKPIGIRPLNDVAITEDSTKKKISLDLPEIDNIGSLEFTTFETPRSSKPLKLPIPRPFKPPEPKNKLLKPVFKLSEKPIKPMDSSDPDEI